MYGVRNPRKKYFIVTVVIKQPTSVTVVECLVQLYLVECMLDAQGPMRQTSQKEGEQLADCSLSSRGNQPLMPRQRTVRNWYGNYQH